MNGPADSAQSGKGDITHLTKSMLVDESSFPNIEGGRWRSDVDARGMENRQWRPPECGAVQGTPTATEYGVAMLTWQSGFMNVMIFLPSDRLDVHTIASSCGKIDDTANPTATWETKPLDLAGIPNWAAALLINDKKVVVFGTYRGVFIRSCGDVDRKNDVAKLFNDEAAKLEAA